MKDQYHYTKAKNCSSSKLTKVMVGRGWGGILVLKKVSYPLLTYNQRYTTLASSQSFTPFLLFIYWWDKSLIYVSEKAEIVPICCLLMYVRRWYRSQISNFKMNNKEKYSFQGSPLVHHYFMSGIDDRNFWVFMKLQHWLSFRLFCLFFCVIFSFGPNS